eukprot:11739298-Karenia_brevis.AAC.1
MDGRADSELKSNYVAAVDRVGEIEPMSEEDAQMGHMRRLTDLEVKQEFGREYTTAAIAALQKNESSFDSIHD